MRILHTSVLFVALALTAGACDGGSTTTTVPPVSTTTTPGGLTLTAGQPVALQPAGAEELTSVVVTHDGEFVIHAARSGTDWTLLAAPTALRPAVTLHEGLSQVGALDVAPDSQTIVYLASAGDGPPLLFAAPLGGGLPVQLWDGAIRLAGFDPFVITEDSAQVVFRGATDAGEALLAVPIIGGAPTVLMEVGDGGHVGFGSVGPGFLPTADSQHVAFLADAEGDFVDDLFVVPLAGGEPQQLNDDPPGELGVLSFDLTDGNVAVFAGNLWDADVTELFSAALDPVGDPVRINDDLPEFGNVVAWSLDPGGERVVFVIGPDADQGAGLFSADVTGGPSTLLAARPSGADPNTLVVGRFVIAPDGRRVAANLFGTDGQWVISAPMDGGEVIQLHPDGFTGRLVDFTPDSQTVVFLLDEALVAAPAAGGTAQQLTPRQPVVQARGVEDGGLVLFTAGDTAETQGLYLVAADGGTIVTVAEPRPGPGFITGALVVPGGERVVFVEGDSTITTGVYLVPLS